MRLSATAITLIGIAAVLFSFISMWLLGARDEGGPRAAPPESIDRETVDRIHVSGRAIYKKWGVPFRTRVMLTWKVGRTECHSPPQFSSDDGTIDLYFEVPDAHFTVVVGGGYEDWVSKRMWDGEIDIGNVYVGSYRVPVLLEAKSESGGQISPVYLTLWTMKNGEPEAGYPVTAPPGRYLLQDTRSIPGYYTEVDTTKGKITVTLPDMPPDGTASIAVDVKKNFSGSMLEGVATLFCVDAPGFVRRVGHHVFDAPGQQTFTNLRSGDYRLYWRGNYYQSPRRELPDPLHIKVEEGGTYEVEFAAHTMGTLSFKLTRGGVPAPNILVEYDNYDDRSPVVGVTTDANGVARFGQLDTSDWANVWGEFRTPGHWPGRVEVHSTTTDENVTHIELTPPGTCTVRGWIDGWHGRDGEIRLYCGGFRGGCRAKVDSRGRFEIEGVPSGECHVWVYSERGSMLRSFRAPPSGQTTVEFRQGIPRITGEVEQSIVASTVSAEVLWFELDNNRRWTETSLTKGRFQISRLPVGRHLLAVMSNGKPVAWSLVTLADGETRSVTWTRLSAQNPWPNHLAGPPS